MNFQLLLARPLFLIVLTISCASALSLSGCTSVAKKTTSQANNADPGKVLKLLYWQAPTILNPHLSTGFKDAEASRITLEPLATFDKNGQLISFLAREIPTVANGGVAPDGKSVTWKLKRGIKWSDGKPFTTADVAFTYQYIKNPKVGATTTGIYENIKNIEWR